MTFVDQPSSSNLNGSGPPPPNAAPSGGGTELDKLWSLLGELSNQLSHNRQQTEELHRRAEELKTQAVHDKTGFTLRRFNVDVTKEEFDSELERLNISLVLENQNLQQENRQLSVLLKDYEGTLEAVMAKFRGYAHATQQHHLDLVRHYESILLSLPSTESSSTTTNTANTDSSGEQPTSPSTSSASTQLDPLHLQLSLAHLGSLVRKALRSLQGEDPEEVKGSPMLLPFDSTGTKAEGVEFEGQDKLMGLVAAFGGAGGGEGGVGSVAGEKEPRDVSTGGYIGRTASTNPHYIPTTSTSSLVSSPPRPSSSSSSSSSVASSIEGTTVPLVTKHDAELRGPVDDALEREIELEQLRRENEELRRLLGISVEMEMEMELEMQGGDKEGEGGGGGEGEVDTEGLVEKS